MILGAIGPPHIHAWLVAGPTSSLGSTLMACTHPGCVEIRYLLTEPPEPHKRWHVCTVAWESSPGPDHSGALVVTGWCQCGSPVTRDIDSVI